MQNKTLLQAFEWYLPSDGYHWKRLAKMASEFNELGITTVWLPPAYKGSGGKFDVGYGVYDTYDLGEFNQKGSVSTKYGTKEDYLGCIQRMHNEKIEVLEDVVLNHRLGADGKEAVEAILEENSNRNRDVGEKKKIIAWTKFTFPARKGKYSNFEWSWKHFDGTDWDDDSKYKGVFRFVGKDWDKETDSENGNYDYLMGADLDLFNPEVQRELIRWGKWFIDTTQPDGFRLDAIKHMSFEFYTHWLNEMRQYSQKEYWSVGEYWSSEVGRLLHYLEVSQHCMSLFDVPLHYHFLAASCSNGNYDLRQLFDGTLVDEASDYAVTFVDNHDTQPSQSLSSWIPEWFKPIAYSIILLRDKGVPCVFYGDLVGIPHDNIEPVLGLKTLLKVRKGYAYGTMYDYFDDEDCVGWTRIGDEKYPNSGIAVIFSDKEGGWKKMFLGHQFAFKKFRDCMIKREEIVMIDEEGFGIFSCNGGSVSVWVEDEAYQNITI